MEIFKLFGSVFVNTDEAEKSIGKVDKKGQDLAKNVGDMTGKVNKMALGVAGVATAVGGGLFALANKTAETADEIDKLSERTGISRENLQEWKYAAGQSGADIGKLEVGVKKLSDVVTSATQGNAAAQSSFEQLGVSLTDTDGKAKTTEQVFEDVMYALSDMEQGTARNALGNDLLGKSYTEMLPLLNAGSDGMTGLKDRSRELGLVMSEENVKANVLFGDTLDDVKQSAGAVFTGLSNDLLPVLQKMLDWILKNMPSIQEKATKIFNGLGDAIKWVTDNSNWLIPVLAGVLAGVVALNVINTVIALHAAWKASTIATTLAQGGLNAVLTANPIGLVVVAIGALVAAAIYMWKNWDTISVKLKAIWNGIKSVASSVFDGIKGAIKSMVNGVISGLNTLIRGLNRINFNIPDWVPLLGGKSFGFNIGEIPAYAKGTGYAKGGYALVGEQGPELVQIPRGSKVSTAEETRNMLGSGMTVNIVTPKGTASEINREFTRLQRQMAFGF